MRTAAIPLDEEAREHGLSARFICLTGKTLSDGRHPIMLQLIHQGKVKRYSTGEACTADQWDKDAGRVRSKVKGATSTNTALGEIQTKVRTIVKRLVVHGSLGLDAFDANFRNPRATEDVVGFLEDLERSFRAEGRVGYSITFRNAASALKRSNKGKPLRFADLTARRLEELERFLRAEGCTGGGIAAYMGRIRVAANLAIKEGLMAADQYPFETSQRRGYSMKRLKGEHNPRALTEADMAKLKAFPFDEAPHLAQSVRLFLLSYYARGMNFRDMAHLKRSDVYDGRIYYRRAKTKDAFAIPVSEALAEILDALEEHEGPYLLPILGREHRTERQQWHRVQKCLRKLNADLKEAAALVSIDANLTSYVARHTYATTLKRKGVDVGVISEALGHESTATTKAYLKRFGSDVLDVTDSLL